MSKPRSLYAPAGFLSREESEAIARRALASAKADETRVIVSSGARANTRFADNQVSTSGDNYDATITVRSVFGKRVANASTNKLDDASLAALVATSEALARLAPEDPELMPELGPQTYAARPDPAQRETPTPEQRAAAVRAVTEPARAAGLVSTGYMQSNVGSFAIANNKGLFAYARGASAAMSTTVRTPDGTGSGWAGSAHEEWKDLNAATLGARAIDKAVRSRNPVAVEPGRYTVILEPTAVANLVQLIVGSLNARSADEGRSFFSKPGGGTKIGTKVVDERVTIVSDPMDPEGRGGLFTGEGLPTQRIVWVENGVIKNLQYDRFWAQKQGVSPTAGSNVLRMSGGDSSVEQMIASTERGILVTRLWYIRGVDPRTILFTGLTRDGTFLVENGRITKAIKNFRWNESPIFMLNNIEAMGKPMRVNSSEGGEGGGAVIVPPIKARDFNFTSLSDAV
ncbi:MAG: TldD/PmbA family protein [Gemmatimonadaceae bacterium]|nr:TldD/PmbA family protein [Gemmatimonadaceae bacterium]